MFDSETGGAMPQMQQASNTQLIFHIGDPKTGTTSIQHALSGGLVKCPTASILPWKRQNAVALANGLEPEREDDRRYESFDTVADWLRNNASDVAVISSEFFAWTKPDVLREAILKHVPAYAENAKILAYARPHASRFLAGYVQRMKGGRVHGDFEEFIHQIERSNLLRYAERFGSWQKVFGAGFRLRPFIRHELCDGDIVADFFSEILQGAPFEITKPVEENVSVTVRSLAGLHFIHHCMRNTDIERRAKWLLGEALANFYLPAEPLSGEKPRLDRATAEHLIRACREDAKALDATFFERPIMLEALENSVSDASDKPFDLAPENHFSRSEMAALSELSGAFAERIKGIRPLYAMHYNICNGNLQPQPKQTARINRNRARLEEIDALLIEMAKIIR